MQLWHPRCRPCCACATAPEQCPLADAQQLGEGASYEDKCRAHIEALMAAAAAAEVQTELAARVASWRAKMDPALAEQDARGDFDIHQCAACIVMMLKA